MTEPIWTKDPSILFSAGTWQKFVPTKDMDVPSALNAVVRFSVYFSVLLYAGTGKQVYLLAIPFVLVITVLFAYIFPTTRALVETFALASDVVTKKYTMPTSENPFMNPLLTEIGDDPNRPDAAPITGAKIKREMEKAFAQTSEIYMDTTDRFDTTQAMRTFHTMQSAMIPNDQDGFLKFLAKGQDEPDHSSAFPSRNAKVKSESYVHATGTTKNLPNTTDKPTGTTPASSAFTSST
jgi:hypothetical protein